MTARPRPRVLPFCFAVALLGLGGCAQELATGPESADVRAAKGGNGKGGGGSGGGGDDEAPDPTVDSTDPSSAPQGTTLDVRVFGADFDDGSSVEFLLDLAPTTKVRTNSSRFISSTELVANVTIDADAEIALYDVQVTTRRGKKGVGIELIAITADERYEFSIVMAAGSDGVGGLRADCPSPASDCPYVEGQDYVGAHLSGSGGNLMFWLDQFAPGGAETSRRLHVDLGGALGYPGGPALTRRIYTNTNEPNVDLRLLGEAGPSTVTTRMFIELPQPPGDTRSDYELRFGVDCSGNDDDGTRASITRTGSFGSGVGGIGDIWHVSAPDGFFLCRFDAKGKRSLRDQVRIQNRAFAFDMELIGLD